MLESKPTRGKPSRTLATLVWLVLGAGSHIAWAEARGSGACHTLEVTPGATAETIRTWQGELLFVQSSTPQLLTVLSGSTTVSGVSAVLSVVPQESTDAISLAPFNGAPIAIVRAQKSQTGSALFSVPADTRLAIWSYRGLDLQALVQVRETGSSLPLAVIETRSRATRKSRIFWFPSGEAASDLLTLERLYHLALAQDPASAFYLHRCGDRRAGQRLTHGGLLKALAAARAATAESTKGVRIVPWSSPRLRALPARGAEKLGVAVQVSDAHGNPVAGADVTFGRGAHLACRAVTDTGGKGWCTLWDTHPDGGGHVDGHGEPTIASFGGLISADRIVLPSTIVWRP